MSVKLKTILIVDDDEDILRLLDKILTAAGFKVLTADNPTKGRDLLNKEAPHIILTDLHMEPEDGFKFIQSVRSQKPFQSTPIIVLSALNDFKSVKKAIALGVSDYVIKPLQSPMLLRKLRKALLNKDFLHWDLPQDQRPSLEITLEAQVTSLGEAGFHLTGPFKLSQGKEIHATVSHFAELGLGTYPQRVSPLSKSYQSEGSFINDVTFVGINETASSKIRQFMKKRGIE